MGAKKIAVQLKGISKTFREYKAVDNVSFNIEEGSFFSLLGPSGCGKTTLLRMIAGFEIPDSGDILFGEKSIIKEPIENRNIGMVFQNYALFPHMSVYNNIAYGLKTKKMNLDIISDTVLYYLTLMGLNGLEKRLPHELSGGQQQRVALARALVTKPFLLLLDEPLSNLDVKLREEIREELMRIKLETKITTVYVTHDQSEALYLADQIAVIKTGKVQQIASSKEIYHKPSNSYTANFVGETNLISANLIKDYFKSQKQDLDFSLKEGMGYSIRPEMIQLHNHADASYLKMEGRVKDYRFYGMVSSLVVEIDGIPLDLKVVYFSNILDQQNIQRGTPLSLFFHPDALTPIVMV